MNLEDELAKVLESKTEAASKKLLEVTKAEYPDDIAFARAFIESQYEMINHLINEKLNLLKIVARLREENLQLATAEIQSQNRTLH